MTGLPKRMKYRGVEFDIHQIAEKRWNWHIYPRMQISIHISDVVSGDEDAAIAKCHSVIDERLGPPRPARNRRRPGR
jgi:hypothetical protein